MSDAFSIRVQGDSEIERFLTTLAARVDDLSPLMENIGAQLESSTADNFKGEHSPDGIPWPKSQRAKETGGKTLTDTRRLFESIGWGATSRSVEIGTNVVYAARHNQGFSGTEAVRAHERVMSEVFGVKLAKPHPVTVKAHSRKGNTPQRQFLGLGRYDVEDILAMAADYLTAEAP